MLKKLLSLLDNKKIKKVVIPRSAHKIRRELISVNANKVLSRLHSAGYAAYLVGGGIRDLLLGLDPKDFDIVTDAEPEQVQELFGNCRLIGRRFRLAHIHFGRDIVEVATFRAHHDAAPRNVHGMIMRDNEFGSIEEDVIRRDFTVNALYYNYADGAIVDFVKGMRDLHKRQICLIGDPAMRYREDPVRMLRAIRFAAKLNFTIHRKTANAILQQADLIKNTPAARLFEEYCKLFLSGNAFRTYQLLEQYKLFTLLFPGVTQTAKDSKLLEIALGNTDARIQQGKSIAPGFLLAVFYWRPMQVRYQQNVTDGVPEYLAYQQAIDQILRERQRIIAMPRRFLSMISDMWEMQLRFARCNLAHHVDKLFNHEKFRAGYDFLLLRAASGDQKVTESAAWWQRYVDGTDEQRANMRNSLKPRHERRGKRVKSRSST